MQDKAGIRRQKRRADRAVLIGLCLMALAMPVSSRDLVPPIATTVAAIIGFGSMSYGVHVAWQMFYEREPEGPAS